MKQCLVSFLSDQSIPNILFIKSISNIDLYLFVTTVRMEELAMQQRILELCPLVKSYKTILVRSDSYQEICTKLDDFRLRKAAGYRFIINITGGNKLMSLAAFKVFASPNSYLFYLPPLRNQIQQIHPVYNPSFRKIDYRLSPQEFFLAYGFDLEECHQDHSPQWQLDYVFDYYTGAKRSDITQNLIGIGSKNQPEGSTRLMQELSKGFGIPISRFNESYWKSFIKGAWFEEYLAFYLKTTLYEMDLITNCKLTNGDTSNEIDLAFSYENRLWVIESKINAKTSELTDFLYKLDSLKQDFGLYPKSIIAVASPNFEKRFASAHVVKARAKQQGITVLTYSALRREKIRKTLINLLE